MKRILCLLLTGLLLFSAAACSAPAAASQPEATEIPEKPSGSGEQKPQVGVGDQTDPAEPDYDVLKYSGYGNFSQLLSSVLLTGTENRNLSPISVYLALAMVAEGASGDTLSELLALLGCSSLEELRGVCGEMLETLSVDDKEFGSVLDMHDSLWMTDSIGGASVTLRDEYLKTLSETYRSEASTVDFRSQSAKDQIAAWITEKTRGKIEVSPDALEFDPMTMAVLINTIYLKDSWGEAFDPENTASDLFYGLDGELTVDYMHRFDQGATVRLGDGWIAYRVYLRRVGYMTFVLPDKDVDLSELLGSPEAIDRLLHAGTDQRYDVDLMIPKFKFQDKLELTKVLQVLGLERSFTENADFSGMSDTPSNISSVLQESYIGVDENGVEAAAYTMVSMKANGINMMELEKLDFHLTRPFFYTIEAFDGTVLFVGTVTNPTAGA